VPRLEDLPFFLGLARHRRLVVAAERLGVNHTTVSRHVAALERSLGVRLFDKTTAGWALTDAGRQLFERAQDVERVAHDAFAEVNGSGSTLSGAVRLATTDGFGVSIAAPWAARLYEQHPGIRLELVTSSRLLSFTSREFDLAVTVHRPVLPRTTVERLTEYTLGLYATPGYMERSGAPGALADLGAHALVWFVDTLNDLPELQFLRPLVPKATLAFQCTTVSGQQAAVATGLGIGLLPRFSAEADPRLVRVLDGKLEIRRTFWLILPEESARVARVREVAEFMHTSAQAEQHRFLAGTSLSPGLPCLAEPG